MFFAAQRYGLVDAPPQLLTEDEWKKVKEKANCRQDFQQPCVICKEELGLQQHVSFCLVLAVFFLLGATDNEQLLNKHFHCGTFLAAPCKC